MRNKHMEFQDPIMQGSYCVWGYIGCKGNRDGGMNGWKDRQIVVGRLDKPKAIT